jgi:Ca2+-binding EF-hand superfamily protein
MNTHRFSSLPRIVNLGTPADKLSSFPTQRQPRRSHYRNSSLVVQNPVELFPTFQKRSEKYSSHQKARKIMIFYKSLQPDLSFAYYFPSTPKSHSSQQSEHEAFLSACQAHFNTDLPLCLHTDSGIQLSSITDLPSDCSYLIVGPKSRQFQRKTLKPRKKKSLEASYKKILSLQPSYFLTKCNESVENMHPARNLPKLKLDHQQLKLKLGEAAVKVDNQLPKLNSLGIPSLCAKYGLSEGELHTLYAKYKILVLLSFAKVPNHQVTHGINMDVFMGSFIRANENSKKLLIKVCSKIDTNGNHCIELDEYLRAMTVLKHGSHEDQIDMFFEVYDDNRNGKLSFEEIKELCKLQFYFAKNDDGIVDYLADSFASLVFDIAGLSYSDEISADNLKQIVRQTEERFVVDMFCSFNCLA